MSDSDRDMGREYDKEKYKEKLQEIDGLGLGFWAPVLRFVSHLLLLAFPCDSLHSITSQ